MEIFFVPCIITSWARDMRGRHRMHGIVSRETGEKEFSKEMYLT
jgi:hypothetical protein